jgi:predicted 2-oxoglutarate/Fe(II)-dependent dioxygenase YbiX
MIISNFFTEDQANFFRTYCDYASNNDSLEVSLVTGKKNEKVDRNYYTLRSHYKFMDEVKQLSEKEFAETLYFQKYTFGHIMHYHTPGQGLEWHAEPNIATVSVSVNLSKDHEYTGAEFQIKDEQIHLPYKAAVFYASNRMHRVTPLGSGQKKSLVMWLQNKEQRKCADS